MSEPYIIDAKDWDPEKHERLIAEYNTVRWVRSGPSGSESTVWVRDAAIAVDAVQREAGQPYIIKAGDFDPEKHERPWKPAFGEWRWQTAETITAGVPERRLPKDFPIVVRDKPKPKTLEEVLVLSLSREPLAVAAMPPGNLEATVGALSTDLREAFPELKDK